jgi:glucosylceramidase
MPEVYQTSADGDRLSRISSAGSKSDIRLIIHPDKKFQTITGFGGAFTESSAYLLNKMSEGKRNEILQAYFGDEGSRYSLCRTHMNSCDFSIDHYSYAPLANDTALSSFSIEEDRDDIIPMIKEAQAISSRGFKLVASPWTAPPWMKTNNDWNGGKLKKEYYDSWALFFQKYLDAYAEEAIPIWAVTVENEPLGNDANWESMHYTPEEMADFVRNHLGPALQSSHPEVKTLVYDQNRGRELDEWADALLTDQELAPYIYGTAVHWYTSTVDWFPESLLRTHNLAPDKAIIHTEGCVDAEVPVWYDDAWYWSKEATDWGYDWAPDSLKKDHPKYVPVYRYARDIIGCLNSYVEGWIDWNMVLDKQGGPNLAQNWCVAPVIVDPASDSVYFTPLYHTLSHFSRFIEPGATRIGFDLDESSGLMATAVENPDGSRVVVILNEGVDPVDFEVSSGEERYKIRIKGQAIQTIIL